MPLATAPASGEMGPTQTRRAPMPEPRCLSSPREKKRDGKGKLLEERKGAGKIGGCSALSGSSRLLCSCCRPGWKETAGLRQSHVPPVVLALTLCCPLHLPGKINLIKTAKRSTNRDFRLTLRKDGAPEQQPRHGGDGVAGNTARPPSENTGRDSRPERGSVRHGEDGGEEEEWSDVEDKDEDTGDEGGRPLLALSTCLCPLPRCAVSQGPHYCTVPHHPILLPPSRVDAIYTYLCPVPAASSSLSTCLFGFPLLTNCY